MKGNADVHENARNGNWVRNGRDGRRLRSVAQPFTVSGDALPDVVGIRPGISAQEGYDLLKKLAPQAQIGTGQYPVAGVTDKPVGEKWTLALRHG